MFTSVHVHVVILDFSSVGFINLDLCIQIKEHVTPLRGFDHVIDIVTPKRTYHLCAYSKKEKEEWYKTLKYYVDEDITEVSAVYKGNLENL